MRDPTICYHTTVLHHTTRAQDQSVRFHTWFMLLLLNFRSCVYSDADPGRGVLNEGGVLNTASVLISVAFGASTYWAVDAAKERAVLAA